MDISTEENGEKAPFLSLLPTTLDAICGMRAAPHDDTILHRLLDTIKLQVSSVKDANNGGLFLFLRNVQKRLSGVNPSVIVLALGVASHLLSLPNLADEEVQEVVSLYDMVQTDPHFQDSSVGAAFFTNLTTVSERGMLMEFCNKHLDAALDTLESAQSVFLLKAAESFCAATIISNLNTVSGATADSEATATFEASALPTIVHVSVELCATTLQEMQKSQTNLLDSMVMSSRTNSFHHYAMQVVLTLSKCERFCMWKAQDDLFVTSLANVAYQHPSERIRSSALCSLVNLLAFMTSEKKEQFLKTEVITPLWKLVLDGEVEKALTIAHSLLTNSNNSGCAKVMPVVENLLQLPCDILFDRSIDAGQLVPLVAMVTTVLADRSRFGALSSFILHWVKRTAYYEGLVRLVESASATTDDSNWCALQSAWPQSMGSVVVGNKKLLNSLMHTLQSDDLSGMSSEQCTALLKCLLNILKRPLVESQLYSQTCTAFLKILDHSEIRSALDKQKDSPDFMRSLVEVLLRQLASVQWEVRDTTLEFITKLTAKRTDTWLMSLAVEKHLLHDAWSCVKDRESYPRASAIKLAAGLAISPPWWKAFLQDCNATEVTLVDQTVELLSSDAEAFPRRAVVEFLTAVYFHKDFSVAAEVHSFRQKILTTMVSATSDFDWEVKVKVLEFWENMASPLLTGTGRAVHGKEAGTDSKDNQASSNGSENGTGDSKGNSANTNLASGGKRKFSEENMDVTNSVLQDLLDRGFGRALLACADDYDSAVKQKALAILTRLLEVCKPPAPSPAKVLHTDSSSNTADVTMEEKERKEQSDDSNTDIQTFIHKLCELDPSHQLQQLGASSDEYDRKPLSLLEDVMTAAKGAAIVHEVTLLSEDEFDDADDMFVDCY